MSLDVRNYFKEIVENIFNRWTALKLAVEHGMAGQNGLEVSSYFTWVVLFSYMIKPDTLLNTFQTAIEMVKYITDCCITNSKVDEENLVELLEDIMDQEFDTICDDNSVREISNILIRYLKMLHDGQLGQIKLELSQLPACDMWIVPGRKINFVSKPDDESSSDEGSDDAMEGTKTANSSNIVTAPSTSGSTMQVEEEDIDPGWTKVKGKRRK